MSPSSVNRFDKLGQIINSTKLLSNDTFLAACDLLPNSNNYDFSNTHYVNIRTPVTTICNLHGEFTRLPKSMLQGKIGCNICYVLSGNMIQLSVNEYKQVASILHKGKYSYSKLINWPSTPSEKITVTCNKHGDFQIRKSAHISPSQLYGCQKCSRGYSRNEEIIEHWLIAHDVEYVYQKRFSDLSKLPYDFFLPSHNLIIEFDGSHHFKAVKFGKSQSLESQQQKFEQIKTNDGIKITYAFDNSINMLRISYMRAKELDYILNFEIFGINSNLITDPPWTTTCCNKTLSTTKLIGYF